MAKKTSKSTTTPKAPKVVEPPRLDQRSGYPVVAERTGDLRKLATNGQEICPFCVSCFDTGEMAAIVPWRPYKAMSGIEAHCRVCPGCLKKHADVKLSDGATDIPLPDEKQPEREVVTAPGDPNPIPPAKDAPDGKTIGTRLKDALGGKRG